jgi:hypothetical protein
MKRTTASILTALTVAATTALIIWMRHNFSATVSANQGTMFFLNRCVWYGCLAMVAGAGLIGGSVRRPARRSRLWPPGYAWLGLLAAVLFFAGPPAGGRAADLAWGGVIYASSALAFILASSLVVTALRAKTMIPALASMASILTGFMTFISSWGLLFFE